MGDNVIFLIFNNVTYTPENVSTHKKILVCCCFLKKLQSKFIGITKITAYFINSAAQSYEASLNKLLPANTNLMTLKKKFIFIFTEETRGLFLKILFGLRG